MDLLFELLADVNRLFEGSVRDPSVAASVGLAPFQARTLGFFVRFPERSQQALVEYTGRDRAQVARVVQELEVRGLVFRETDPTDRRKVRVRPTQAGLDAFDVLYRHRTETKEAMLRPLSDGERETLIDLLQRMKAPFDGSPSRHPDSEKAGA